jgi:putative glutamine amidotransferase
MSMSRPVIGIATQTLEALPGELPPCWIMGQKYVHALRSSGAIPWLIPLIPDDLSTLREIYQRLDGIFLTGGVDVDPSQYGEHRASYCGRTDPPRDAVEIQLIRWSLVDRKPILAVCRGIQVVNVALGGNLFQDVASQRPGSIKHDYFPTKEAPARDYLAHSIRTMQGSRLRAYLGEAPVLVNSMHHQAIKNLAPGLVVTAVAPDGVIEGVEGSNGHYLLGVQWHPEELTDRDGGMQELFTSFVRAATPVNP